MNDVEKRVYGRMFSNIAHVDENYCLYIYEDEFDKLGLSENKDDLIQVMKNFGIEFRKRTKKITKDDRSPLVRDFNYGEHQSYGTTIIDNPVMSKIEYYEDGQIKSENYKELEKFLEKDFIPSVVNMKRFKNRETGEVEIVPSIQLNKIVQLRLSELENKHVVEYLDKQGIRVSGYSQDLDGEFENYDYYRTYKKSLLPEPLSKDEQREKFVLYQLTKDPVIREQLILHNLRLVPYAVWKLGFLKRYPDIAQDELEQYGYIGLMKAVEKFDATRGYSFYSFAKWDIMASISNGIFEIRGVKKDQRLEESDLTLQRLDEITNDPQLAGFPYKFRKIIKYLELEYGRMPTYEEIAWETGTSVEKIKEIVNNTKTKIGLAYHLDISELYDQDVIAWNVGEDMYEDEETNQVELHNAIEEILDTLSERESKVLRMRFGFDNGKPMTYEEVGQIFGVTRERIRQIEAKAIRKLRHPSRTTKLRSYNDISSSTKKRI